MKIGQQISERAPQLAVNIRHLPDNSRANRNISRVIHTGHPQSQHISPVSGLLLLGRHNDKNYLPKKGFQGTNSNANSYYCLFSQMGKDHLTQSMPIVEKIIIDSMSWERKGKYTRNVLLCPSQNTVPISTQISCPQILLSPFVIDIS